VAGWQTVTVTTPLDNLVQLLDLETIEVNTYRGQHPEEERQRTFGGQVAAQALMAAGRTVERGRVHSLHSYFLRPGDPTTPILYEVDRIRDGRSFTTRRVVAIQHGRAIYNMQASFHTDEVSLEHQFPMPEVPDPETIAPLLERVRSEWGDVDEWFKRSHPIDQRFIGELPWSPQHNREPRQRLWIRADGSLADDPLLHACVVTYASDMSLFDAILAPHTVRWDDGTFMGASLDHCMWFHRDLRADEWLLYDTDSPIAHGGRGLARGFLFNRDGELCVSMVQEGLVRVLDPTHPHGADS
jgi:acyl-CoA thioesterase-2